MERVREEGRDEGMEQAVSAGMMSCYSTEDSRSVAAIRQDVADMQRTEAGIIAVVDTARSDITKVNKTLTSDVVSLTSDVVSLTSAYSLLKTMDKEMADRISSLEANNITLTSEMVS